ncbi:glutamine synthetase beta-grasp domain-containing protein [Nonomuraea ferruginea]
MSYKAEYIWIDGTEPTALLRSKTKILADGAEPPVWGFDGSSTNQAKGFKSDLVLRPVLTCPDPIRGGDHVLVLCEVEEVSGDPHKSNTRAQLRPVAEQFAEQDSWFGIEQEYTFFKGSRPLGFPEGGFPAPQGHYYCGVGAEAVFGREIVELHLDRCLAAGLKVSGINAEVMPGQWEFQIGPAGPLEVGDHLWIARWLLYRTAEEFGVEATLDAKPARGDWNGAERAHQLLHQGHARGLRRDHHRLRGPRRRRQADGARQALRRRHREPPDRRARDRPVEQVHLRRLRPRRVRPHPVAGRGRQEGLHRGPPPERQRRPVRGRPPPGRHLLHRPGEGRPGLTRVRGGRERGHP